MGRTLTKRKCGRPKYFRVRFTPQGYGCVGQGGRLLVVLPGETRRSLGYCGACPFEWGEAGCVFHPGDGRGNGHGKIMEMPREELDREAARKRARGQSTGGQPLIESCWNCQELRVKLAGYVCRFEPEASPMPKGVVSRHRKVADTGCQAFVMRLVLEIPPLDGEL